MCVSVGACAYVSAKAFMLPRRVLKGGDGNNGASFLYDCRNRMNRTAHVKTATPTTVMIENVIFCENHSVAPKNRFVEAIVSFAIFAEE